MLQPFTLEEFKNNARQHNKIAVFEEISLAEVAPLAAYEQLSQLFGPGMILEDLYSEDRERYSFLCFEPCAEFCLDKDEPADLFSLLRAQQKQQRFITRSDVAHLITHAVGFFSYAAVQRFEHTAIQDKFDAHMPDCFFQFFNVQLAFNLKQHTLLVSVVVEVGEDPNSSFHSAKVKIQQIIATITAPYTSIAQFSDRSVSAEVCTDLSDAAFMQKVKEAQAFITKGEAFQIVISRCFTREYSVSPFLIYQVLREQNPAPFMFYFPLPNFTMLGASPERLIQIQQKKLTVFPIAGTRPRHAGSVDVALETDLLSDAKEVSEHIMLVDLARNDVGKISIPGSIDIQNFMQVKHYARVSHITTQVTGEIKPEYDALDALQAAFPAGTLTGAPKIRAMQIIQNLEVTPRGLYGGAICRLDAAGDFDSFIAIRMGVFKEGIAQVRAGAGIVHESQPEQEAQETIHKASALLRAIAIAQKEEHVINN